MANKELKEISDTEIADKEHLVAFLDILGFRKLIKDYSGDKSILNNIKSALELATSNIVLKGEEIINLDVKYNQFSDCTCISMYHPSISELFNDEITAIIIDMLYTLISFQIDMMKSGLFIRGGLSTGFHYADDNMIFSKGLIKAYDLESKKAVYPRIILDDELVITIKFLFMKFKSFVLMYGIDKLLISDEEGLVFINPFNRGKIMERLALQRDGDINSTSPRAKAIKKMYEGVDKREQSKMLIIVENKIEEYEKAKVEEKILTKYKWLRELIKWNQDHDSSKIKFEYLLK